MGRKRKRKRRKRKRRKRDISYLRSDIMRREGAMLSWGDKMRGLRSFSDPRWIASG